MRLTPSFSGCHADQELEDLKIFFSPKAFSDNKKEQ